MSPPVALTDGFEHLDRNDVVVLASDIAIVDGFEVDERFESGSSDPLLWEIELRGRQFGIR